MTKPEWERVTFLLRKDTYNKLIKKCQLEDRPMSYFIRSIVEKYLEDDNQK